MSARRTRRAAFRATLTWGLAAVLLAMSVLGAIASTHAPHLGAAMASLDAAHAAHEEWPTDAPHGPGLAGFAHDLAHAWHDCGAVMAVLEMPVIKLPFAAPAMPLMRPAIAKASAPIAGLFRPPIR